MPGLTTTTYASGDFSWLLTTRGLDQAITGVIDISTFTQGTHFPNGYLPSGLPVRIDDRDVVRPWADTAGAKLGFLKGDVEVNGADDLNAAFLTHGDVKLAGVQAVLAGFAVPTTAVQPQFNIFAA